MVFQQNVLEKAYFIAKIFGPTTVPPASSDFWKAPLVKEEKSRQDWLILYF